MRSDNRLLWLLSNELLLRLLLKLLNLLLRLLIHLGLAWLASVRRLGQLLGRHILMLLNCVQVTCNLTQDVHDLHLLVLLADLRRCQ